MLANEGLMTPLGMVMPPPLRQIPPAAVPLVKSVFRLKEVRLLQSVVLLSDPAFGAVLMAIGPVVWNCGHPPTGAMVYWTE